jgi:uncharacterized radical SAM superfamily Fe-S cluster-containing enzyme
MQGNTHTESLCPVCLARIPAYREAQGEDVFMVKQCIEHGDFKALIWKGPPSYEGWRRSKTTTQPPVTYKAVDQGCPFDCGLCPDHRQRSCTVIVEVTKRCNLSCTFCYADSKNDKMPDPTMDVISNWYHSLIHAGCHCNIQLSGGEPTIRNDLPSIVACGRSLGFQFIQLNTNGIRLARDREYVSALKEAGLTSVFLQFDGTEDEIYQRIRGQRLLEDKLRAIEICGGNGIGVVLVPTLIPGVNDHNIGDILKEALKCSPVVRAVHFQPVSYFGRYLRQPRNEDWLTLPELMRAIETQSEGLFRVAHFRPPGCENAHCSFHGNYIVLPDGAVQSLQKPLDETSCWGPESAEEGALRTIAYVARQWAAPEKYTNSSGCCSGKGAACFDDTALISLDDFISRARTHTFSVSAMAFQDVWNLDLERVRDCCIHVVAPNGNLIPFCAYNLTSIDGRHLYRP